MMDIFLYLSAFAAAFLLTAALLPPLRARYGKLLGDRPSALKNHQGVIPAVGGLAVAAGFFGALLIVRAITNFPTGTLHNLRGIFLGGFIILSCGLIDDLKKPAGLAPWAKLALQTLGAVALIGYDIQIHFLPQPWGAALTILWVVGVTNAINLTDIMDGLAASQAALAALAFALIALPAEFIYVNLAACALLGACLGFWPYNHSRRLKSFLGDSGSNLLGFLLAALALGARYSQSRPWAVLAPLLILALPLFDTAFVSIIRVSKGQSPLRGSPDHIPLRLERAGISRGKILILCFIAALICDAAAIILCKIK